MKSAGSAASDEPPDGSEVGDALGTTSWLVSGLAAGGAEQPTLATNTAVPKTTVKAIERMQDPPYEP